MHEKHISKTELSRGDYSTLYQNLQEKYPKVPFSIEETPTEWILRIMDETDMDAEIGRQLAFPKLPAVWLAQITEITTGAKPLKIKRGNHEAYAYVSNVVKAVLAKLVVGDNILVMFVDGDRDKPVVVG